MEFAEKLDLLLKKKGMKQREFAEAADMNASHANKFFNGRKPNMDFLEKVIKVFPDVNMNWLLFGEGDEAQLNISQPATHYQTNQILEYLDDIQEKIKKIKSDLTQN